MKSAYLRFSVIALDAKQFHSAKQCRMLTDTSQQERIAREMIASLELVLNREDIIDRYVAYYAGFSILSITYSKEIVKLALSEQHAMLQVFIQQSNLHTTRDQYVDICTGYINLKSSLFFPELWPHPNHNLPRMISFSNEYIKFLSSNKKGSIKRSKIFEAPPDILMDEKLFWELTGMQGQDSLDNSFLLVTRELAATMIEEIITLKPADEIRDEHILFTSFLQGVVQDETILIFEYGD